MTGHHASKHITFVVPWMGGGGVERTTLALMHGFVDRGYAIDLVLTEEGGNFMHLVPKQVHIELFECPRVRHTIARLRDYMQRRKPDVMIVAVWPVTVAAVIARIGLAHQPRLILSDHNHLTTQYAANSKAMALLHTSLRLFYPLADALVGVSNGVSHNIARTAGLKDNRVTTIYNPTAIPARVDWPDAETTRLWHGHQGPRIISVGRMNYQKNHSLLLRAFAKIYQSTGAKLVILGEGEDALALEAEVVDLGLTDAVIMPGFVTDPSPYYASADVFALSSDFEGFGNVLVEAMHFGLSIVSTDCNSGPSEVLENGRYGRLTPVGDADALAEALKQTIADPSDPGMMKARAHEFSIENATNGYENLLTAKI